MTFTGHDLKPDDTMNPLDLPRADATLQAYQAFRILSHANGFCMFCVLAAGVSILVVSAWLCPASAQSARVIRENVSVEKSTSRAVMLNLALPGLGHRYLDDGAWSRMATFHAGVDVALWLGLLETVWREGNLIDSYTALAAGRGNARVEGKDRRFFLDMANYISVDAYLEAQLRDRRWERLEYAGQPEYYWAWKTEADQLNFRELRDKAERMRRRRPVVISMLAGNRLISATASLIRSQAGDPGGSNTDLSLGISPVDGYSPALRLLHTW